MLTGILTTYLARFASLASYVILLPIVLNAVGADVYGIYAMTVAMAALFQQDLGMGGATTRFVAVAVPGKDYTRIRDIAVASLMFYVVAATAMAGAAAATFALVIPALNGSSADLTRTAYLLAALGTANVFLVLVLSSNRQLLVGIGRLSDVNALLIGQALLRVALTAIAVVSGAGIIAVATVDLGVTLALGLAAYAARRIRLLEVRVSLRSFQWRVLRELFSMSYQLMIIGLASALIMQAGSVIAVLTVSAAAGAAFAAGNRAYQLVKEVTNSLSLAVLPAASMRYSQFGVERNTELYVRGTMLANMLMLIALVPALMFMDVIMTAWVGDAVAPAATVVAQILVASLIFNNNHLLALPVLTAQGAVTAFAMLHTIWAVSAVALSALLGTAWGAAGVAAGIVIPVVVLEPLYVRETLRRLGFNWSSFVARSLGRPYLTVAPLVAALWVISTLSSPSLWGVILLTGAWGVAACAAYWFVGIDHVTRRRTQAIARRIVHRLRREGPPDLDSATAGS